MTISGFLVDDHRALRDELRILLELTSSLIVLPSSGMVQNRE